MQLKIKHDKTGQEKHKNQEKKTTLLLISEGRDTQKILALFFDPKDFRLVHGSCSEGVRLCVSTRPDLVLLDTDLPESIGRTIIKSLRDWSQVPIIILSAKDDDDSVIAMLDMGANDFVSKPFNGAVLRARIMAVLRTAIVQTASEPVLYNGALRMDLVRHDVMLHGQHVALTPREYELLRYFMVNRGKMLLHKDILRMVWGRAHCEDTTYLRVYIRQLREKIEADATNPIFIITENGIGYRMEDFGSVLAPNRAFVPFRLRLV